MDKLEHLAQEARELLAEIDAVLDSLHMNVANELSGNNDLSIDDAAEDWV